MKNKKTLSEIETINYFEDEKVISINNFKDYDVQVKLPAGKYKAVLTNYGDVTEIEDTVTLRPYEGISAVKI